MASANLMKVLATPSKIASALDWKKIAGANLLTLDIHSDRIGMAISCHPSFGESACSLEPIRLAKKGRMTEECKNRLVNIVKENKVCGVVVSWPLQTDTGKMGAACGRVLYTLEQLLDDSEIVTKSRPMCLWDGIHPVQESNDIWGRNPVYARTSDKAEHRASQEQYYQDENVVAKDVWDDFCRSHWPEIYKEQQTVTSHSTDVSYDMDALDSEDWEDSSTYVNAALL